MAATKVWDLPGWDGPMTVYRMRDTPPDDERWGWFWPDGHGSSDQWVGYDHFGGLLVYAGAHLERTATMRHLGPLVGPAALAWWRKDPQCGNALSVWIPPEKYGALHLIQYTDGYLHAHHLLDEPPPSTIIPERGLQ